MALDIRPYTEADVPQMIRIWDEVVEAGNAFPQVTGLNEETGAEFFASQTASMVAVVDKTVFGLYILHPNNIGRCAHIANASYAVGSGSRGLGLGTQLVIDSISSAAMLGFRGLQYNAVVASNAAAIHVYEKLGFTRVGAIPRGFINSLGAYEDMYIYYKDVVDDSLSC